MLLPTRPTDAFWRLVPPQGLKENPLNYRCAPNEATPDYVAAHRIEQFIANAFIHCWLEPDTFGLWPYVRKGDVQELRGHFLSVLENVVLQIAESSLEEPEISYDCGTYSGHTVEIDNRNDPDDLESATEVCSISWLPHDSTSPENGLAMELRFYMMETESDEFQDDPTIIWLAWEALQDLPRIRAAIEWARYHNDLPGRGQQTECEGITGCWDKLGVERLLPKLDSLEAVDNNHHGRPAPDTDAFWRWAEKRRVS